MNEQLLAGSDEQKRDSLRRTRFFADAAGPVLERLAAAVEIESIPRGEPILIKDRPGRSIYIIEKGWARVHDGDLTLAVLGERETFGELSTLEESICSASVTADTDMVLLRLDRGPLLDIMSGAPGATALIMQSLCRCLRERSNQFAEGAHLRHALEREMEIGRKIQAGFLPGALPDVRGWEVGAYFRAAREVAGDFYDAFEVESANRIALIIGDVCDKGVGAALFMTLFRSLLRAAAKAHEYSAILESAVRSGEDRPSAILRNSVQFANNYIAQTHGDTSMFATLFFGLLDPKTGHLSYINGGHEAPFVIAPEGLKEPLDITGPAVGLFNGVEFGVSETVLGPGETLFSYTDGVVDAANPQGDAFSTERLASLLASAKLPANELVANVAVDIDTHAAGAAQFDDITMLAVSRRP
jgi:serine phosphatase RsbU (regulator of sigma subunit)